MMHPLKEGRLNCPMSDGSDNSNVEQVAREYVQRHGPDSPSILRDFAELSDAIEDIISAEAWRDIADAAERILKSGIDSARTAQG
jgi:hypothetical protein